MSWDQHRMTFGSLKHYVIKVGNICTTTRRTSKASLSVDMDTYIIFRAEEKASLSVWWVPLGTKIRLWTRTNYAENFATCMCRKCRDGLWLDSSVVANLFIPTIQFHGLWSWQKTVNRHTSFSLATYYDLLLAGTGDVVAVGTQCYWHDRPSARHVVLVTLPQY
jgi:hypothetical protein